MQKSISTSKPKRSIYSNFIYQTNNNARKTPNKTDNFKSASSAGFLGYQAEIQSPNLAHELKKRLTKLRKYQDSGTQTSKTILELAQIESGSISPDSLNESPKTRTKTIHNSDTQTSLTTADASDGYDTCENESEKKERIETEEKCVQQPPNSAQSQREKTHDKDTLVKREEFENDIDDRSNVNTLYVSPNSCFSGSSTRSLLLQQTSPLRRIMLMHEKKEPRGIPFTETHLPNYIHNDERENSANSTKLVQNMENNISDKYNCNSSVSSSPRSSLIGRKSPNCTYMAPTISSENKNAQNVIRQLNRLFAETRRGRSASPDGKNTKDNCEKGKNIPYVDRTMSTMSYDNIKMPKTETVAMPPLRARTILNEEKIDCLSLDLNSSKEIIGTMSELGSYVSCENFLTLPLAKLRNQDWNTCIQGLAEIVDFCRMADVEIVFPHMTTINQRVIELLRSPRSHVCRTACQAAGHLFEFVRDTRRPEFDELVDLLLFKTADANKFIRQDANLALDCMVTHIPCCHSIRALCSKGPTHKNHLVRTATVRLIVCAAVISGPDNILNPNNSEHTRKRIFHHLPKFLEDKNLEVRKFGERLYKVLFKEFRFDLYLKKYLDKEEILRMKKNLRNVTFRK